VGSSRRSGPPGEHPGSGCCRKGRSHPASAAKRPPCAKIEEETGARGRLVTKLGDVRYWFSWEGERIFKVVSFFLVRYEAGRLGEIAAEFRHEVAEVRWFPLAEAPALLAYEGGARASSNGRSSCLPVSRT